MVNEWVMRLELSWGDTDTGKRIWTGQELYSDRGTRTVVRERLLTYQKSHMNSPGTEEGFNDGRPAIHVSKCVYIIHTTCLIAR
jgi:hypothetical protein